MNALSGICMAGVPALTNVLRKYISAFCNVKKRPLFADFQALKHLYFYENADFLGP